MLEENRVGTCWGVPAAEGGWMLTLGSTRVGTCWGFRVGTEVVSGVALEPVGEYEYVERSVRGCKRAGITGRAHLARGVRALPPTVSRVCVGNCWTNVSVRARSRVPLEVVGRK